MGSCPLFKKGILFTNEINKGAALTAFLQTAGPAPTAIIFIDDRLDHLESVEKALAAFDPAIRYDGLHFQGDHGQYRSIEPEDFSERWLKMVARSREILSATPSKLKNL
jgi:hypothetical protein